MTSKNFRENPNCLGAKVDRIVMDFPCRYCEAPVGGRCHTKSGALDPCYHHLRWQDAGYAYDQGYRTSATDEVPGYPSHESYRWKKPKRKPKPAPPLKREAVLLEPQPWKQRMLIG